MKDWFLKFSQRDQIALLILLAALGAYMVATLILLPLHNARAEMRARNEATVQALQRVDAMAVELEQLRQLEQRPSGAGGNLAARLSSSAGREGLQISRLQPNGRGAVQLRLESASLKNLLRWLHSLETTEGLLLEELSLGQTSSAGVVSASLRIAVPG